MNLRATVLLFVGVLLLGGFIWFFDRRADSTEDRIIRARQAVSFHPSRITRIQLSSAALKLQLAKQGDGWRVTSPIQAAADDDRIEALLTQILLLPNDQVITSDQLRRRNLKRADFGLDQPRWRISLGDRDAETVLLVGRDTPNADALYIQVEGRRDVIVTSTNIIAAMPASVADFRSRLLLAGSPDSVVRVELRSRAGFAQASRGSDGGWQLARPVVAPADAAAILATLRHLFAARIVDFESSSKVGASLYGFDEPEVQCSVVLRDGAVEQTLLLGKPVSGRTNLVYATTQGSEEIFTVDAALSGALALSPDELRDRRLLTVPAQRITGIRVESADASINLARTNGAWFLTQPRLAPADEEKIRLALAEWSGARVRMFNDAPGTNPAALGLSPPARKISFSTGASAEAQTITYEVSSHPPEAGTCVVRISGTDPLLHIDSSALDALPLRPLYFRSPEIFSVGTGAVRSLTYERAGTTNVIALETSNGAPPVVTAALKLMQPLRARDLVTQDSADLARYGLQPASASLAIGLAATGSLSRILLIGNTASGGGRYATVQGLDIVFTLDERDIEEIWKPAAP